MRDPVKEEDPVKKTIRKLIVLAAAVLTACVCIFPAAAETPDLPAFRWKDYECRFAFYATDLAPFGLEETAGLFPDSAGNMLAVRLEAVEGTLDNNQFHPYDFCIVMPDGSMFRPLFHQVSEMRNAAGIMLPASQQEYFILVYDRGSLTEETLGEASIAVFNDYEDPDAEPAAVVSFAEIPPYAPAE